jgi:hypothetical protein
MSESISSTKSGGVERDGKLKRKEYDRELARLHAKGEDVANAGPS